jgi:hypothetical protein
MSTRYVIILVSIEILKGLFAEYVDLELSYLSWPGKIVGKFRYLLWSLVFTRLNGVETKDLRLCDVRSCELGLCNLAKTEVSRNSVLLSHFLSPGLTVTSGLVQNKQTAAASFCIKFSALKGLENVTIRHVEISACKGIAVFYVQSLMTFNRPKTNINFVHIQIFSSYRAVNILMTFNPSKTGTNFDHIQRFSSYRAVTQSVAVITN